MLCTLAEALEEFRQGRGLVLADAPDREDEGDPLVAAQFAEPAKGRQLEEFAQRFGYRSNDVEPISRADLGGARR